MSKIIFKNKKAYHEYNILEKVTAGLVLFGSEVKSIKSNNVNIEQAYCFVDNNEIFIKNMYVSEYKQSGLYNNHEPLRDRKLLLKKKEIQLLYEKVKQKGVTIIPLNVMLSERGLIKVEIALAKGKHLYDKRMASRIKTLEKEKNNYFD